MPEQPASPAPQPILVLDDDPASLEMADRTLRELGYRSVGVADGTIALRVAERLRPAGVILDLVLPGIDAFEFLDRFRRIEVGRTTAVIVWTLKTLTTAERQRLAAMADAVVPKGAGTAQLREHLRAHLPRVEAPRRKPHGA